MEAQEPSGKRLVAFFALMYYAGLRPEEVVNLRDHNVTLPPLVLNEETGEWEESGEWGELRFAKAAPLAGREWTDDGTLHEERTLKHRAEGTPAPCQCRPSWSEFSGRIWPRRTAGPPTAGCSPACAEESCPASPTGAPGPRPGRTRSPGGGRLPAGQKGL
ncbi:hypothetical protein [Nonomuraea sp. NPDC005501]|uniref:hypothetical protein n=1 Tax=Nonomuraea sp. NPDC005501 TaxID=3156884 RepID=UPI0033AA786B